ncbi:unnamed protein product, partial [Thlaspi arvense]
DQDADDEAYAKDFRQVLSKSVFNHRLFPHVPERQGFVEGAEWLGFGMSLKNLYHLREHWHKVDRMSEESMKRSKELVSESAQLNWVRKA